MNKVVRITNDLIGYNGNKTISLDIQPNLGYNIIVIGYINEQFPQVSINCEITDGQLVITTTSSVTNKTFPIQIICLDNQENNTIIQVKKIIANNNNLITPNNIGLEYINGSLVAGTHNLVGSYEMLEAESVTQSVLDSKKLEVTFQNGRILPIGSIILSSDFIRCEVISNSGGNHVLNCNEPTNRKIFYLRQATSNPSAALGLDNASIAQGALAAGKGLIANKECQNVIGSYNKPDDSKIQIVGNGTDSENRSNIYTLDADGNAEFAGKVIAADPTNDNELVTLNYLKNVIGGGAILPEKGKTLEEYTWDEIRQISDADKAIDYFHVGDRKKITLNGQIGDMIEFNNYETYVYILGMNHNKEYEGSHKIHFGCFFNSPIKGKSITINNLTETSSPIGIIKNTMNHWGAQNYGGWAACDARYDILGSTDRPPKDYGLSKGPNAQGYSASTTCAVDPVPNTLMSCLPNDLRQVMKPIYKYYSTTDNSGGLNDYLPLASEIELLGMVGNLHTLESHRGAQKQYDYYKNGNSVLKYSYPEEDSILTLASKYWTRNINETVTTNKDFIAVNENGTFTSLGATSQKIGIAPIFAV